MGDRFAPPSFPRKAAKPDGVPFPGVAGSQQQNASFNALARYVTGDGNGNLGQMRSTGRAAASYQVGGCQSLSPSAVFSYVVDTTHSPCMH